MFKQEVAMQRNYWLFPALIILGSAAALLCGCDGGPGEKYSLDATEQQIGPDYGIQYMPSKDRQFLDDFNTALKRFKTMNLDDFTTEYGPRKAYSSELGYDPLQAEYLDTIQGAFPLSSEQTAGLSSVGFTVAKTTLSKPFWTVTSRSIRPICRFTSRPTQCWTPCTSPLTAS